MLLCLLLFIFPILHEIGHLIAIHICNEKLVKIGINEAGYYCVCEINNPINTIFILISGSLFSIIIASLFLFICNIYTLIYPYYYILNQCIYWMSSPLLRYGDGYQLYRYGVAYWIICLVCILVIIFYSLVLIIKFKHKLLQIVEDEKWK